MGCRSPTTSISACRTFSISSSPGRWIRSTVTGATAGAAAAAGGAASPPASGNSLTRADSGSACAAAAVLGVLG